MSTLLVMASNVQGEKKTLKEEEKKEKKERDL